MPIAMSCDSCGKQLRAKDESAGKKIKCPCGNVLTVPQSEEMTEEMGMEETAAPAPPPPPAKITVSCGCGKKLQVKAELAGKAVKCPGCQKVVKVPMPASNGAPAPAPAAAKKSAPPAKKPTPPPADDDNDFSFAKAPLPKAGKKTPARMPDEQEEDDDFGFTAKPKSKKAVSRPLDDDEDDQDDMDEDFRVPVRAKPQKSSKGMLILIVVLLLVVGLGVAGYFTYPMFFGDKGGNVALNNPPPKGGNPIPTPPGTGTPGTGTPGTGTPGTGTPVTPPPPPVAKSPTRDFDLIARDAMGFATVRVGAYLASDEGKRLRNSKIGAKIKEGEDFLGVPFEDIERVSLVVLQPDDKRVYAVVQGKKPFDLAKFAAKNMAQSTKVGDKELLLTPDGGGILKLDEELLLMGKAEILQELAQKAPAKQGPLDMRVKEAQDSNAPIFLTAGSAGRAAVPPPLANQAKDIQGFVLTLAEGADDIELNAAIQFASEDQAKAMLEMGKELLGKAGEILNGLASDPKVSAEFKTHFPKIQESLRDLELNTQDNSLTIAFKLSGVNITNLAEAALSSAPESASKENMHKLITAMRVYDSAKMAWPDSLDQLEEHAGGKEVLAKLLMNPVTGENPGYEYVKPKGDEVGSQVVLYQLRGGKRDLKLPVGYGDTAVRMIDPSAPPGAEEKKKPLDPEEKKPLDPEEKKTELPPLPVPPEKKTELPPLPVPPEKKLDLPGLPLSPEKKLDLPGLPLPPEKKLIVPLPPEPVSPPPEKKLDVPPPEKTPESPPPVLPPEKKPDLPPVLPPEKTEVKPALPPLPVPPPEKKVDENEKKLTVTPPELEKQ